MYKLPKGECEIAIYNIKSQSQSKQIQGILFKSGFLWWGDSSRYRYMDSKSLHPWGDGYIRIGSYASKRAYNDISAKEFILRYSQNKLVTRRIHK